MFFPLELILIPALLDCSLGLNGVVVSSPELTVQEGDSVLMGCVFQGTEEKRVTKVDWMRAEDDYVLYYYANLSVPVGRFQNRVHLVGDLLRTDGSLLLQDVEEADQGTYTCEIRFEGESILLKKKMVLHVLPSKPKEVMAHMGDSARMRCVFQSTEEKTVSKVDWTFSSGEHAKNETVLHYDLRFNLLAGYPQPQGRFQNRVALAGDVSRNDGSIMLQRVKESDGGLYTCSIHLGDLVIRKTVALHVILEKPPATPATPRPEVLGGTQLVIIVGIVCATLLLLPVLILIVKKTHRSKSSVHSEALVKSLENMEKANPEKHIYSSINTCEAMEAKDPHGCSEATYMIMHPVRPSLKSVPAGEASKTEQAF